MRKSIEHYIKTHIDTKLTKPIFSKKPHVLVGLSGGPDSVFLLHILKTFYDEGLIRLSAAHLNHGWRDTAPRDEMFCKELCATLSIPFIASHAKDLDRSFKHNGSQEETGRKMRRYFFEQTQKSTGADYIALAHHQQDQQETFFLRLIRGCSLDGLTGIKPVQGYYIRPLLQVSKQDIVNYLDAQKIIYMTDESNLSDKYLRNRIRKHVLPAMKSADNRFDQKFETSLEQLKQDNIYLQNVTKRALGDIFAQGDALVGNQKLFIAQHSVIQKRLIIDWLCRESVPFTPSHGLLEEIRRFLAQSTGGSHRIHTNWLIQKKKHKFWIEKAQNAAAKNLKN